MNAVKVKLFYAVKKYLLRTYSRPDSVLNAGDIEMASPVPISRNVQWNLGYTNVQTNGVSQSVMSVTAAI